MTKNQKILLDDYVIKSSPLSRHRIANVIKEYESVISELKGDCEQERVISDGFESVIVDFEKLVDEIYSIVDNAKVRELIEEFRREHEG